MMMWGYAMSGGGNHDIHAAVLKSVTKIIGTMFDNTTGTLEERIRHCLKNCDSTDLALQLRNLLDILTSEEL